MKTLPPTKHGFKIIPQNLSPNKDRATRVVIPSNSTIYRRLQKRKQRQIVITTDYLNDACRMKVATKAPSLHDDRRLLQIYNNVHLPRPVIDDESCCDYACVECSATDNKFCYCGAGLVANVVQLQDFVTFVKSPRNPSEHFLDPGDQEEILETFRWIGCVSASEILRVLVIFAMISNEAVMEDIGERVKRGTNLDDLFKQRSKDGLATFRGGQFAGSVTVANLGKFLTLFIKSMRGKLAPLLEQWSQAGKSKVTCVKIVRQILKHIGGCTTSGFGPYKKKIRGVSYHGRHRQSLGLLPRNLDWISF